ncbi:His/Gly/Thr/Pro-type tRNA ligase C-terminal domain-containing protein [Streptomyces boncukensis]|uniref:His/Gly/Thr/Pro-type tRNA ligase C-terminal domain-containing protein n=1 Tax=Streptomyces boncukensis TaxID=2711219 RepID=UPI003B975A98
MPGSSTKLAKQLTWANGQNARVTVLYGPDEQATGEAALRNMRSGEQTRVPLPRSAAHLSSTLTEP